MENNCNIIGDLMPLSVEGIASDDSAKLVAEHIKVCDYCKAAYEEMKSGAKGILSDGDCASAAPLRKVKKDMKRNRTKIAVLCALGVFVVMVGIFSFLMTRQYIPYSENAVLVEELPSGKLKVSFPQATGYDLTYCWTSDEPAENEEPDCVQLELWQTRWDKIISRNNDTQKMNVIYLEGIKAVDYCDFANDGELIRVYGDKNDWSSVVLERLVLGYYVILSVLGTIIFGILWLIFRKRKAGKVISYIFFVPVSYLLGHLVAMGTDSITYAADEKFVFIMLAAAAIYAMTVVARKSKTV